MHKLEQWFPKCGALPLETRSTIMVWSQLQSWKRSATGGKEFVLL